MRFLIIDDSMPMRRIIANVLTRLGHTDVVQAVSAREALKRLETDQIDFVITDWYMPEVGGLEFIRVLRENERTRDLPIVVVTGNGSKADVVEAVKLGVKGYILKPFTAEILKERIAAVCTAMNGPDKALLADDGGPPAAAGDAQAAAAPAQVDDETATAPDDGVTAAAAPPVEGEAGPRQETAPI